MARPRVIKYEGETIVSRPNMVRCRYTLSNGQILTVRFQRHVNKAIRSTNEKIRKVWLVAVHIGDGKRADNRWRRKAKGVNTSTGKCGLEGLRVALGYIHSFCTTMGLHTELQVGWSDKRRARAYKYLLRYDNFTLYENEKGEPVAIAARNPEYWIWEDDKGEEPTC